MDLLKCKEIKKLLIVFIPLLFIGIFYIKIRQHHFPSLPKTDIVQPNLQVLIAKSHNYFKARLFTPLNFVTIYVHGPHDYISREILAYSTWEGSELTKIMHMVKFNPDIQLLDLGCNLGVYSLYFAALGKHVVAVDANKENTDRLVQSVVENRFTDRVIVVNNAVSSVRQKFRTIPILDNIGGQHVYADANGSISSIYVDDLVPFLLPNLKVLVKVDVETHEFHAFKRSSELFKQRNVVAVMMEWKYIKETSDAHGLIDILTKVKFHPFKDLLTSTEVDIKKFKSWPEIVVWKPST